MDTTEQLAQMQEAISALENKVEKLERQLFVQSSRAAIENRMSRHQWLWAEGRGQQILDELWAQSREDVSFEYGASGVYRGPWPVASFYRKDRLPGKLSVYHLTTQQIEIAADGQTAQGAWFVIGTETDAGDLGTVPHETEQERILLTSATPDGKRYRAEWLWQKYEVDFILEGGIWKILHFHVREFFKCPFDRDWVRFSGERVESDGMWLEQLFESNVPYTGGGHFENLPGAPTTSHWQYKIDILPPETEGT